MKRTLFSTALIERKHPKKFFIKRSLIGTKNQTLLQFSFILYFLNEIDAKT